jgi:ATP-dependent helicase/DNAse subunit B
MRTKRTASAQGLDRSNEGKTHLASVMHFSFCQITPYKHFIVYVLDLKESLRFNGRAQHWKELFKNY